MPVAKAVHKVETDVEGGRNFIVLPVEGSSLFRVSYEGGGVVPKELSDTLYTSVWVANKAIEAYIAKRG